MIELKVEGGRKAALALSYIKSLAWDYPGDHELVLLVPRLSGPGRNRLALGPTWRYGEDAVPALRAYGEVTVTEGEAAPENERVGD